MVVDFARKGKLMINPYINLQDYVGKEIEYKDFCKLVKIQPSTGITKIRQLKEFNPYMEVETSRNKLIISKLYGEDEMLLVKRNSNFAEYFENLLIVHLSNCEENLAKFTYSEVEQLFCLVNSNYMKTKYDKKQYITSQDLKKQYNRLDFDSQEIEQSLSKNMHLFFDISDRTFRRVIDNALKSMAQKSLILVNESFRLYREVYVPDINSFRLKPTDCTDEQCNEILDIKKRLMDKYSLKSDKDIFFMKKEIRDNYYDDFSMEIKSSDILEHNDRCGKLFIVNLGKEGLKVESDKIDKVSNEKMLNTNIQYKLLTTKDLMCVNDWLKKKLVADVISDNYNVTDF